MQTILVVDDEPLIRWAVREGLESAGLRTSSKRGPRARPWRRSTADGRRGGAARRPPARLGRSGAAAPRPAARRPACRVIMMTAHGTPELLAEAMREGAFGTVSKPFDMSGIDRPGARRRRRRLKYNGSDARCHDPRRRRRVADPLDAVRAPVAGRPRGRRGRDRQGGARAVRSGHRSRPARLQAAGLRRPPGAARR